MPSTATITAKYGPALQATAAVITNVSDINFDLPGGVLSVYQGGSNVAREFELSGANTILLTAVGGNYTLTVT